MHDAFAGKHLYAQKITHLWVSPWDLKMEWKTTDCPTPGEKQVVGVGGGRGTGHPHESDPNQKA